jgi:hypothetical protein|tara:strand:+ start:702 stop:821 length:120 start_codon:yes stop_codon:yes gene_type:complete
MNRPEKSSMRKHWGLDDKTIFLNHGSYGATPTMKMNISI